MTLRAEMAALGAWPELCAENSKNIGCNTAPRLAEDGLRCGRTPDYAAARSYHDPAGPDRG